MKKQSQEFWSFSESMHPTTAKRGSSSCLSSSRSDSQKEQSLSSSTTKPWDNSTTAYFFSTTNKRSCSEIWTNKCQLISNMTTPLPHLTDNMPLKPKTYISSKNSKVLINTKGKEKERRKNLRKTKTPINDHNLLMLDQCGPVDSEATILRSNKRPRMIPTFQIKPTRTKKSPSLKYNNLLFNNPHILSIKGRSLYWTMTIL